MNSAHMKRKSDMTRSQKSVTETAKTYAGAVNQDCLNTSICEDAKREVAEDGVEITCSHPIVGAGETWGRCPLSGRASTHSRHFIASLTLIGSVDLASSTTVKSDVPHT